MQFSLCISVRRDAVRRNTKVPSPMMSRLPELYLKLAPSLFKGSVGNRRRPGRGAGRLRYAVQLKAPPPAGGPFLHLPMTLPTETDLADDNGFKPSK